MTKSARQIVTAALAAAVVLSLVGCRGTTGNPDPALTGIAVTTPPTKTVYAIGEEFDPAGMVVTASYDDGSSREVPHADLAITGFDSASAGTRTVTVTYRERTATTTVTVNEPTATLESIAVTTPPTRTAYVVGEEFDPAGMVVTATFDNGSTQAVTGYAWSPTAFAEVGSAVVTVTYQELTATTPVTVSAPTITITTQPEATTTVFHGNINEILTVAASVTGGGTVGFQWFEAEGNSNADGTAIADAIAASFAIPDDLEVGTHFFFAEASSSGADSVRTEVAAVTVQAVDDFVVVPGGTFEMGRIGVAEPVRTVTVSGFRMGRFHVTQGEWYDVMGTWPSFFDGTNDRTGNTVSPEFDRRNLPVEQVRWYEVLVFANRLSESRGLSPAYEMPDAWPDPTGWSTDTATWGAVPAGNDARWNEVRMVPDSNGYRLPTEAQWEFAARGGDGSPGNYEFSGSDDADEVGWYNDNSGGRTREVGELQPNGLELYDMSGNLWEWIWDWRGDYDPADTDNPTGASSGTQRVVRGGSWMNAVGGLRTSARSGDAPASRFNDLGFRLVRP